MDSGEGTKSKTQTRRKRKAIAVEQEPPSADNFFAENKKMAGFDNPGELLYTTVRVLVENALDSAESIRQLPSVEVTIEEIPGSMKTGKASQKKALGKKVKAAKGGFYRVTCKDNGRGMTGGDIHKMFGGVLCGTNDGAKQTRGESGLGKKMAFLWAKMSTGEPVEIFTSKKNQNRTTFCILDMDIDTNVPDIQIHEKIGGKEKWHGAEFKVVIQGEWTKYGLKILEYMRRTSLITPYAEFTYRFVADTRGKEVGEYIRFPRRTEVMPRETKYFASAVNVCMMEGLIAETPKQKTLLQFIKDEFGWPDALNLLFEKMGVTAKTKVGSLKSEQLACMLEFFQQADPSECLSPVGADNLRLGIIEQLEAEAECVATYSTRGGMLEGHPFILEVGVCVEGEDMDQGITVFRFANRVPLLFEEEEEDDFVTSAVNGIDWKRYMINSKENAVGVFVSIVSTKFPFPFKGTGVDQAHMACLVRAGLESCCLQLEGPLRDNVDGVATCVYDMVGILSKMKDVKMSKEIAKLAKEIEAGNVTLESYKEKLRLRV